MTIFYKPHDKHYRGINIKCNSQRNKNRSITILIIKETAFIMVTKKLKYVKNVFFLLRGRYKSFIVESFYFYIEMSMFIIMTSSGIKKIKFLVH